MTEQRKYAILDTDFVSKANIIKTENRMLANVPIEFVLNDIYGGCIVQEEMETCSK